MRIEHHYNEVYAVNVSRISIRKVLIYLYNLAQYYSHDEML